VQLVRNAVELDPPADQLRRVARDARQRREERAHRHEAQPFGGLPRRAHVALHLVGASRDHALELDEHFAQLRGERLQLRRRRARPAVFLRAGARRQVLREEIDDVARALQRADRAAHAAELNARFGDAVLQGVEIHDLGTRRVN